MTSKYFYDLKKHQIEPVEACVELIRSGKRSTGKLIIGGTGVGKTVIAARATRIAQDNGWLPRETSKLASVMYLGPNPTQTKRVFYKEGVKNTQFLPYSALRSATGEMWLDWIGKYVRGEMQYIPVWNELELPDFFWYDEVQKLKNPASQQSLCVLAAASLGVPGIALSATPWQKTSEAETIFRITGLCREDNAAIILRDACGSYYLDDNSPSQTKRVKEYLKERGRLIEIKNARFPFPVKFFTTCVNFRSPVEKQFYAKAYEIYLIERAKHKSGVPQGINAKWVAMQKFWEAAELLKSFQAAEIGVKRFKETGKQIVIACNFITPLRNVWRQLVNLGVDKKRIAFIIGGQSEAERQKNVDRFQCREGVEPADFLLMTVASGGTSLDLPHDDDARNRPRHVIVPLCWSVYSFLQLIGRVHRMSSRSLSTEEILIFSDTIEETDIKPRLDSKIQCIGELQDRKDSFIMDIFNKGADEDINNEIGKSVEDSLEVDEDGEKIMFDSSMLEVVKSE